ncbi:MAG: sulfotransferase [Alphaproteobacteria bacterium]
MTPRWAVHIGVEKSGTTTLQRSLFPAHPEIDFVGKPFEAGPWPDTAESAQAANEFAEAVLNIWTQDSLTFDAAHERARALSALETCQLDFGKLSVLAEEALSTARAVDRALVADRLKDVLGDAKILITIRSQPDAILSLYEHLSRKGTLADSFDTWVGKRLQSARMGDFVSSADIQTYRYDQLVDLYADKFGRENVGVFLFEDLRDTPDIFARDVATFLEVDADEAVTALGTEWHNKRKTDMYYSVRGAENRYARIRERFFPWFSLSRQAPALWRLKERIRARAVDRTTTKASNRKRPSPEIMRQIEEYFRPHNARLESMIRRELPASGYGKSTPPLAGNPEAEPINVGGAQNV